MKRPKPFLTYFILCAIPLLLLAGLNYWNGIRTVDSTLRSIVQNDLNSFNVAVDEELRERESAILKLAMSPAAKHLVSRKEVEISGVLPESPYAILNSLPDLSDHFPNLVLFNNDHEAMWYRANRSAWTYVDKLKPVSLPQPDSRVWTQQGNVAIETPGASPSTLEFSAPIHDERGTSNVGAVLGLFELESVFSEAARGLETRSNQNSMVVAQDHSGKTLYHSDRSRKLQSGNEALPGSNYVTASAPIPRLNVNVAVARNASEFLSDARRRGIAGLVLALLVSLAAAFLLERHVQRRSRGIARVTEDVSAIAKGDVDRRIILQSSDDARGLADSINVVTERLRVQIAREEESRQFDSFVRLSAMLTHDLKNAIEGLSLTVSNMERHFDNPQFRLDALRGLTSATDKLRAIVARLARPVTTLSGEHKRPTPVDLVPILQRVISMTAEPMRGKHTVITRLPPSLLALADPARIEEVMENLVLNALEAMDKSGTLTIEAGHTTDGKPTFSVSDTGRGMSRTFIDTQLFRPFSTTKKTGIGLGLYTCREVIKAGAGTIEVDSVEGAGTTFRVVLPSLPNDRRN